MEDSIFVIQKDVVSDQIDKNGQPLVELKKGDVLQLKDDGIYFTRKVNVGRDIYNYKSVFEDFKRHGS